MTAAKPAVPSVPLFGLPQASAETARVAVLPIPLELTTSYGGGAAAGPAAVIDASEQVEWFDYETGFDWDPHAVFHTVDSWLPHENMTPESAFESIRAYARPWVRSSELVVSVGGEHSVTTALLAEVADHHGPVTVVWLDAHADLRTSYEGSPYSHASVANRGLDMGHSFVQVGIRAICRQEWELAESSPRVRMITGPQLHRTGGLEAAVEAIRSIRTPIYLSIDVDGLDPSIVPGTGTPVPGGITWAQARALVSAVFDAGQPVVGIDVVECAPIAGQQVSEFASALLLQHAVLGWLRR